MLLVALLLVLVAHGTLVLADRVMCPIVKSTSNDVVVDTDADMFNEISGMAISLTQSSSLGNPILFAVNDRGDGPRLGIFDSGTGDHLITLIVAGASNIDWESLSLGPCGTSAGTSCLYISDAGDNEGRMSGGRNTTRGPNPYRIYKVREPNWVDYSTGDEVHVEAFLDFDYASFAKLPFVDSEALFVDPTGWGEGAAPGDLYVVAKWNPSLAHKKNRIFYIPVSAWTFSGAVYSPAMLGPWDEGSVLMGPAWTSAEMSPDGTLLAFGNNDGAHVFLRCPGASIKSVLDASESCLYFPSPRPGRQYETVAWTPDGANILRIPEGPFAAMSYTALSYDVNLSSHVCPFVVFDEQGVCRSAENNTYPASWCDASTKNATVNTTTMPLTMIPSVAPSTPFSTVPHSQLGSSNTPTKETHRPSLLPSLSPMSFTLAPSTAAHHAANEPPQSIDAQTSGGSLASPLFSALVLMIALLL